MNDSVVVNNATGNGNSSSMTSSTPLLVTLLSTGYIQEHEQALRPTTTSIPQRFRADSNDVTTKTTTATAVMTSVTAELFETHRLPVGVVIVLVLAGACLLLGVIYGYIYFTRIVSTRTPSPTGSAKPSRKSISGIVAGGSGSGNGSGGGGPGGQGDSNDDDLEPSHHTHMFLFRMYSSRRQANTIT